MRRLLCTAALAAGLLLVAANARAGSPFGISTTNNNTRLSSSMQKNNIGPTSFLGSPFRLREIFRGGPSLSNRHSFGSTKIPTPGTSDYMKAFGYKKLF